MFGSQKPLRVVLDSRAMRNEALFLPPIHKPLPRDDFNKIESLENETIFSNELSTVLSSTNETATEKKVSSVEFASTSSKKNYRKSGMSDSKERLFRKITALNPDIHLKKYLDETSQWRDLRSQLKLPELKYEYLTHMHGSLSSNIKSPKFMEVVNEYLKFVQGENTYIPKYEPTYQLEPFVKFNPARVEDVIIKFLANFVENMQETESLKSGSSNKAIIEHVVTSIKSKVKPLVDKRYRLIVYSVIGEIKYQGMIAASKFFWDNKKDYFVSVKDNYKNFFILVNLYAVYKE
jgi:hypothetical protein